MKFKATPAQNIALHTLQSVGLSALVTFIVGLGQFVALHGLDWPQLTSFAAGGFLAAMSMMWKTLSGNPTTSQNTMQAVLDTLNDIKQVAAQPPVTIHNNLPAPALSQPTASKDWVLTPSSIASAPPAVAGQSTLQFVQPAPFPYQPSSTYPQMPAVQP